MIFLWDAAMQFEEEEEEVEGDLNDALLDELDDDDLADADDILEVVPPLPIEDELEEEEEGAIDATAKAFFDDEETGEDEDDEGDYDSFDDKDEL